ncbi:hypothetical protein ACHAPJ_011659 [Fusarium lateritium]
MRPVNLFNSLLGFIVFEQCHAAVSWTKIGCNTNVGGASMDAIWENALNMSGNAQKVIGEVNKAENIAPWSKEARIASNAKSMWGINYEFSTTVKKGLPDAAQETLEHVSGVYGQVDELMKRNAGYLICSDAEFIHGKFYPFESGTWYVKIPGTDDKLVLRYTAGLQNGEKHPPCSDPDLMGKSFEGIPLTGKETGQQVQAMLFCANNHITKDLRGTLALGFSTGAILRPPNPNTFSSAAGSILHEMLHVLDDMCESILLVHSAFIFSELTLLPDLDQQVPEFEKEYPTYMFNACYWLALKRPLQALRNPDNYRVFAEMCQSPLTWWMAPRKPIEPSAAKQA